jgi:hypothetical protein
MLTIAVISLKSTTDSTELTETDDPLLCDVDPVVDANFLTDAIAGRAQPRPGSDGFLGASASSAVGCPVGIGGRAGCAARKSSTDRRMSLAI